MQQPTELSAFLDELHDEVHARTTIDEAASADSHEMLFTELIAEELGDYGAIDELVPCLIEQKTTKGRIRANGYYIDEDGERLDSHSERVLGDLVERLPGVRVLLWIVASKEIPSPLLRYEAVRRKLAPLGDEGRRFVARRIAARCGIDAPGVVEPGLRVSTFKELPLKPTTL